MKRVLASLVLVGALGCGEREQPVFSYEVFNDADSHGLLSLEFPSYDTALAADEPFTVTTERMGVTQPVTLRIGYCSRFSCLGPVSKEQLYLIPEADYRNHVGWSVCEGLEGRLSTGIDTVGTGDCKN
jgi:hypothetical protein